MLSANFPAKSALIRLRHLLPQAGEGTAGAGAYAAPAQARKRATRACADRAVAGSLPRRKYERPPQIAPWPGRRNPSPACGRGAGVRVLFARICQQQRPHPPSAPSPAGGRRDGGWRALVRRRRRCAGAQTHNTHMRGPGCYCIRPAQEIRTAPAGRILTRASNPSPACGRGAGVRAPFARICQEKRPHPPLAPSPAGGRRDGGWRALVRRRRRCANAQRAHARIGLSLDHSRAGNTNGLRRSHPGRASEPLSRLRERGRGEGAFCANLPGKAPSSAFGPFSR